MEWEVLEMLHENQKNKDWLQGYKAPQHWIVDQ